MQVINPAINYRTRKLIRNAILKNKFLGDLDKSGIEDLVSAMYPKNVKANTRIILEGDVGEYIRLGLY